jgi:DmsE family decaheme c-type cytochrome
MIKAENNNQLCYKCHADKRGPYIWEHPPVEEDCMKCHSPHGTKAAKLLKEKQPQLCQSCHDWSRHPGTPYGGQAVFNGPGSALGRGDLARGCTACHGTIHGSNAPGRINGTVTGGKRFIR